MRCIRVAIANRQPMILQGLISVLEAQRDFRVVATCTDGASCIEALRSLLPDIAILDTSMPNTGGLEILAIANSELPTRLVFFAAPIDDRDLQMSAATGGHAVIPGDVDPPTLVQILRQVVDDQKLFPLSPSEQVASRAQSAIAGKPVTALTARERQIMRLVSEGLSNKEIGRRLHLTDGTIKVHLHKIFQKLDVGNRTALAALAISHPDIPPGK